jgi:AcrR family transcriptional regulator
MTVGQSAVPGQLRAPAKAALARAAPARALSRQLERRERVIEVAMEQFAANGYENTRAETVAAAAGVSKGAVFAYFGSKAGLFLAAYKAAASSFSKYLDAPASVLAGGFFAVLAYWVEHTPDLIRENWVPYRVTLLGNYCSDLELRRSITQFLRAEDPYGTRAFVRFGIDRHEVRTDIDAAMIASLIDWLMDRCQDAIVTEALDPGLFSHNAPSAELHQTRLRQFVELLRGAVGVTGGRE